MAFAITDGQLAAVGVPVVPGGWPAGAGQMRGVQLSRHFALTYGQIYRSQPAVRTVVDFLARNVAGLPCKAYEASADGKTRRELPVGTPGTLPDVVGRMPNLSTTAYRLWHSIISDRAIYDAAYVIKVRDAGGRTVGLRRIPVPRVTPAAGSWLDVTKWRIMGNKTFIDIDAADMLTFPGYDPDDTRRGVSPIETLRSILAEQYAATAYNAEFWQNGARTSGVILRPADAPDWADPVRKRFLADWAAYAEGGNKAGGAPILEDGMTWVGAGVTPKNAQYVEVRKLTREEVASEYHIPPPLVGVLDHATFSNIQEQHLQLYVDTLGPWLISTSAEVDLQLVPDFAGTTTRTYVLFDLGRKLQGDFEQTAAVLQAAVGGPYMTRNEARNIVELPPIEGGDELITPLNVTTGGLANPQDTAPPDNGKAIGAQVHARITAHTKQAPPAAMVQAHIDGLTSAFDRQRRSVVAAYQRLKAVGQPSDIYDRARWDRELGDDLLALAVPLAGAVGAATATDIDGTYDPALTPSYLAAQTAGVASGINQTTQNDIQAALTAHDVEAALVGVFALAIATRAPAMGRAQATSLAGWASVEAGRQSGGEATKTWITGEHPRQSHAAMSGQTVALDVKFSNGARWPADSINLGVDEVAGCNCSLIITPGGTT